MVLVDTSVWIHFLANRAPYAKALDQLLSVDEAVGHELIYGELLIGDKGGMGNLLDAYQHISQAASVPHKEVVHFVRSQRLHGRGVGWIDIHLLASALVNRLKLWTADPRCAALATELGIPWHPSLMSTQAEPW